MMAWLWSGGTPALKKTFRVNWRDSVCPAAFELDSETDDVRTINPLVRFADLFSLVAKLQDEVPEEEERELENVLLQLLACLDRQSGIDRAAIAIDVRREELPAGRDGARAQSLYTALTDDEQAEVARLLMRQEDDAAGRLYYDEAVAALFPDVLPYYETQDDVILLYLPRAENEADKGRLELLERLFLDRTAVVRVFWGVPFGILGEAWMTKLDQFQLY